jgi:hypothetical protein
MLYTSREKLTVLEIDDDTESVGFDTLRDLLMERPSNMIYVENSGGYFRVSSAWETSTGQPKRGSSV